MVRLHAQKFRTGFSKITFPGRQGQAFNRFPMSNSEAPAPIPVSSKDVLKDASTFSGSEPKASLTKVCQPALPLASRAFTFPAGAPVSSLRLM